MANKTYSEKLKDPRWQKKRLKTFDRDGWTCRECAEMTKELHAHHLYYVNGNDPWEYPDEDIITLCVDCHKNIDWKSRKPFFVREDFFEDPSREEMLNFINGYTDFYFTNTELSHVCEIIKTLHESFPLLAHDYEGLCMMLMEEGFHKFVSFFAVAPERIKFFKNTENAGITISNYSRI